VRPDDRLMETLQTTHEGSRNIIRSQRVRVVSLDSVDKRATKCHGSLTGRARRESRVARDSSAGFHRPRLVRHTCSHGWAIQSLTAMRLRESHYLLSGRRSREGIAALRCTNRRPPSPDDRGRWRTPEGDRVPGIRRVQRACARCSYFIHAIEGHHRFFPAVAENQQEDDTSKPIAA